MKRILIIGGSYFFGRVYTMFAAEKLQVIVFNRGTYSMADLGVIEIKGDRTQEKDIENIPVLDYDAVVDFCAYNKGDIEKIYTHLKGYIRQYIFISTVDVTRPKIYIEGSLKTEESEYTDFKGNYPEEMRKYIEGKIELEKEVKSLAQNTDMSYTILRPAVLYGPYNYAPREAEFVRWMITGGQIVLPRGADMRYSLCYVKDAALMTLGITGLEAAYDKCFNLAAPETASGEQIADGLINASGMTIQKIYLPEDQITGMGLAAPFGGSLVQSQIYDGERISELTKIPYTNLATGLEKTFNAFKNVYSG